MACSVLSPAVYVYILSGSDVSLSMFNLDMHCLTSLQKFSLFLLFFSVTISPFIVISLDFLEPQRLLRLILVPLLSDSADDGPLGLAFSSLVFVDINVLSI